jgi:hypothetical protein
MIARKTSYPRHSIYSTVRACGDLRPRGTDSSRATSVFPVVKRALLLAKMGEPSTTFSAIQSTNARAAQK